MVAYKQSMATISAVVDTGHMPDADSNLIVMAKCTYALG